MSKSDEAQANEHRAKTWFRIGAFVWGSVFLGFGLIDGMYEVYEASELFFGGTGVSLIIGSITGKAPKLKDGT